MLAVLVTLEQCRVALLAAGNRDTAQLISVAILELRMKVNRIDDDDLKTLCDEMLQTENPERLREPKLQPGQRRQPLLRLVK
jgi:ADP-ribosylglycohydrolase